MPTGLTGRWRVFPASLTLFVAVAWLAASVMWGSSSWSNSLPLDFAVRQTGSNRDLWLEAPDGTLDVARVRLIAEGVGTSRVLEDLIPSPAEFERRFPNGAVLVAAFGKPSDTLYTTRQWGWPIAWCTTRETRWSEGLLESLRWIEPDSLSYVQLHIQYGTRTGGIDRNVRWNLGPPALCVLLVMITYPVLRFAQARLGRHRNRGSRIAAGGTALAAILVAVLVFASGGSETESLSGMYVPLAGGSGVSVQTADWATLTEADLVSMVEEEADARRVAEVILDYLHRTAKQLWVLHVALIHPVDVEKRMAAVGVTDPLPLFFVSRSKIVRVSDSGEVERAFRGPRDLVEWSWNWVYLHVPTGRSSDVTFQVNWGGLSVCLVFLWVIWVGVRRFSLVCLGARTARRSRRGLCVCCAYPVPT